MSFTSLLLGAGMVTTNLVLLLLFFMSVLVTPDMACKCSL